MGEWSEWESGDIVGIPNWPDGPTLDQREILRRVAARFPLAVIDRERGDRIVRAGADRLAALHGSPTDPAVERHLALLGRVVHVTIRDVVGGPQFGFFLTPDPTAIHFEYERPQDREAGRPLLEALAAGLADYYLMNQDLDTESENPDDGRHAGAPAAAGHGAVPRLTGHRGLPESGRSPNE